jgi:hypothetical protein
MLNKERSDQRSGIHGHRHAAVSLIIRTTPAQRRMSAGNHFIARRSPEISGGLRATEAQSMGGNIDA